jgi:DNA-binding Xre family transcriptional regulator
MKFEKGHKKLGGRQKGTLNKKRNLEELFASMGLDPFSALAEIAANSEKEDIRLSALKELCQYLEPKRKALEHSGEIDTNPYMNLSFKELEEKVKAKLASRDR